MLLPLVFALTAPTSFVHAVEARVTASHMHLVDWWADDLDGDHVPESIAFVCGDDAGVFLVAYAGEILEAPAAIDGRNSCPEAPPQPPTWRVLNSNVIHQGMAVHHGQITSSLAIREHRLVRVREDEGSIDVGRDGTTSERDHVDYDELTWRHVLQPPKGRARTSSGPLVVVTDLVRRATRLVGASTLAATRGHDATTLHVHADRPLVLRDCTETPCRTTRVAKGEAEVQTSATFELEVITGRSKLVVHLVALDGEASYPPPDLL